MKSGLEGRNNTIIVDPDFTLSVFVSMKSGLEGRNNASTDASSSIAFSSQ